MRSIRHSLIVYFLFLLTGALSAVSWFAYQTTAQSLRERQRDSRQLIEAQCEARIRMVGEDLDRNILKQAQRMASLARSQTYHLEGLYPLGLVSAAAMPGGHLNIPLWLAYDIHPKDGSFGLAPFVQRSQSVITHIADADLLIPEPDDDHGQEYFQTYRHNGQVMERSESMENLSFTLDPKVREKMPEWPAAFDEVELKPGLTVRRVTLKAMLPVGWPVYVPWPWRGAKGPKGPPRGMEMRPGEPRGTETGERPNAFKLPKWSPGWARGRRDPVTAVFIQYACDLAPTAAKVRELYARRDAKIVELDETIEHDLGQLRSHLFWIALVTLLGIWLGGYTLVRVGLSSLMKMSDAVGEISPQNLHLALDSKQLPEELQPIANRLALALEELRKAFAREKQAAADISHELRTPLAALMTTLEVGLRKTRSVEEYKEILEECRGSGQHMYQLVERLLMLARLDAGADQYSPADVDAVEIALQCADLVRPLARERGLEMRLHLPDPVTLHTDPNKLHEVITNLLHNAVEYNRPNGSIELAVERTNGHVGIEVRDTGIGISSEAQERIFERFYRADPSRHADTPHAGLGLAIVKSYIDLMGGTIQVASSTAGSTFTIELPAGSPHEPETGICAAAVRSPAVSLRR
jgi:heavy metal sensor kinase